MKLLTVVGARPQLVKAAMVSRAIHHHNASKSAVQIAEEIVHTGQHYDPNMSESFFRQLQIPEPRVNLQVGSGLHGETTGRMLGALEQEILTRKPDWVLVYGDTNSTLAGALAAAKLHVPVAHVEAGLRSFNKRMPEEVNRILTDHVSSILFCPTQAAVRNLAAEGITRGVEHVGDVMYDAAITFGGLADRESSILTHLKLSSGAFLLATVHRAENTDDPLRLGQIMQSLQILARDERVVLPLHPRTRKTLEQSGFDLAGAGGMSIVEPLPFIDMVQLEKHARVILTDSGGVQKEAYFHGVPCVTLRDETEWVETVAAGWNQLAGADAERIVAAVRDARCGQPIPEYGRGEAGTTILRLLVGTPVREMAHPHP